MNKFCVKCNERYDTPPYCDMYISELKKHDYHRKYLCWANKCYKDIYTDEQNFIQSNIDKLETILLERHLEKYIKPPEITINTNNSNTTNHITNITYTTRPIKIYGISKKSINDIETDMVLITIDDYRKATGDDRPFTELDSIMKDKEMKRLETQKEREEKEKRYMEHLAELEKRDKNKAQEPELKARREVEIRKSRNEIYRRKNQELLDEYKDIPNAKLKKCNACNENRVHPVHYVNEETNEPYMKLFQNGKSKERRYCCVDCYYKDQNKYEEYKLSKTKYCDVCKCNYLSFTDEMAVNHLKSNKHKKNIELRKLEKLTPDADKPNLDLSKFTVKELQKICNKTLMDDGTPRIPNYTKVSKIELVKKMNENYEFLVLTL